MLQGHRAAALCKLKRAVQSASLAFQPWQAFAFYFISSIKSASPSFNAVWCFYRLNWNTSIQLDDNYAANNLMADPNVGFGRNAGVRLSQELYLTALLVATSLFKGTLHGTTTYFSREDKSLWNSTQRHMTATTVGTLYPPFVFTSLARPPSCWVVQRTLTEESPQEIRRRKTTWVV